MSLSCQGYKSGLKYGCLTQAKRHPRSRQATVEHQLNKERRLEMKSAIALPSVFFVLVIMGASADGQGRIQWAKLLAQLQDDLDFPVIDPKEPTDSFPATNVSTHDVIMQELGMR